MGVRIVYYLMTNHRTSSVFARHNIISGSPFDCHLRSRMFADPIGRVTGPGGSLLPRTLHRAITLWHRLCGPYDGVGRV